MRGSRFWEGYLIAVGFVLMNLGFVFGGVQIEFIASGCDFGYMTLAPGTCSQDGTKYCGDDLTKYDTVDDELGCSRGNADYDFGDSQCCPAETLCGLNTSDGLVCSRNLNPTLCIAEMTFGDCSEAGCFWFESEGCIASPREFSCSSYTNETECETDVWNLGKEGIGTVDTCGADFIEDDGSYFVPPTLCECAWADDKCSFKYTVVPDYYDENSYVSFNCSVDFNIGECLNDERDVNWTASVSGNSTAFNLLSSSERAAIIAAAKCSSGDGTRFCGQPLTRLPGFSLLALIISLGFIGMFYFLRERR